MNPAPSPPPPASPPVGSNRSSAPTGAIHFARGTYTDAELLGLYRQLLRPRLIEEKMLRLLRRGKVSKWFSGIGQEAISVGCALALEDDEYVFTMHRNLGVFTARGVPFGRLYGQWQGRLNGYTKGRDRSFHFGAPAHHIVGMISHLGPQLSLAAGVGLAHRLRGEGKVALAFTGDGATSQGEFHEALNLAAVWRLPVVFVIENNGYGLSTPTEQQYACEALVDRARGYGMEGISVDGNNVLEVHRTIARLAEGLRADPRPVLVECRTFRMRGHEEASGVKYVPPERLEEWARRDPLETYAAWLRSEGLLTDGAEARERAGVEAEIERGLAEGEAAAAPVYDAGAERADVYAPSNVESWAPGLPALPTLGEAGGATRELRFVDAVAEALAQAMERHAGLVLMGQDIADYGGVFKATEGLLARFGASRVRNTPLCESGVVGAAIGYHLATGAPAMVEMQFGDFVTCAFNQLVNNAAKLHYRWGQSVNLVVRMPCGGGVGAGPFHSQTNEAWFAHVPGLKVVYPSSATEAKGLLLASFDDPNPVLFFEHKGLYRSETAEVPTGAYRVPLGEARVVREGTRATVVTYGLGVRWAEEACAKTGGDAAGGGATTAADAADVEIVDLRTLVPLDIETVVASVRKTGRALVVHEDNLFGGVGAELAAQVAERAFDALDAPVMRVGGAETPIPFARELEAGYEGRARVAAALARLLAY